MTDELGREELLEELEEVWENNYVKDSKLWKRNEQAYRQLKALIQEPGEKKGLIGMAGEIFNEAHENQLEVTEEWIEEKAQQLFQESKEGSFSIKSFCNFFIRKIIEEMPAKKAKRALTGMEGEMFNEAHKNQPQVSEEFVDKWKSQLLHEHNVYQSNDFPEHYKFLLECMLTELGVEVMKK